MAVVIVPATRHAVGLVADRRLCETAQGQPCEADDPAAAALVVGGPGAEIPARTVARLGLRLDAKGRITWGAAATPPHPTARREPPTPDPGAAAGADPDADADADADADPDADEVLPTLVPMPGGWYQCQEAGGALRCDPDGNVMKVRGKDAARRAFGLDGAEADDHSEEER